MVWMGVRFEYINCSYVVDENQDAEFQESHVAGHPIIKSGSTQSSVGLVISRKDPLQGGLENNFPSRGNFRYQGTTELRLSTEPWRPWQSRSGQETSSQREIGRENRASCQQTSDLSCT
jgi:hypothetical protein